MPLFPITGSRHVTHYSSSLSLLYCVDNDPIEMPPKKIPFIVVEQAQSIDVSLALIVWGVPSVFLISVDFFELHQAVKNKFQYMFGISVFRGHGRSHSQYIAAFTHIIFHILVGTLVG
eukprot:Sdes_comp21455_c0_seq1m20083